MPAPIVSSIMLKPASMPFWVKLRILSFSSVSFRAAFVIGSAAAFSAVISSRWPLFSSARSSRIFLGSLLARTSSIVELSILRVSLPASFRPSLILSSDPLIDFLATSVSFVQAIPSADRSFSKSPLRWPNLASA